MKISISIFLFCLVATYSFSQTLEYCGTKHVDKSWLKEFNANRHLYAQPRTASMLIPIVVHLLGTTEGQNYYSKSGIYQAVCTLNKDFAPANIRFYIREFNYINNTEWFDHVDYDAGEEMMVVNNIPGVVNCYIVRNPAGNCGYYSYRGDAVALSTACIGVNSHTWAHEFGHFFSLPHTFSGWEGVRYNPTVKTNSYLSEIWKGIENVADPNCGRKADDFCDTPADYLSYRWDCSTNNTSSVTQKDLNEVAFKSDGSLFMSYASDLCMSKFSPEQMDAMRGQIQTRRPELINHSTIAINLDTTRIEQIYPIDTFIVPYQNVNFKWTEIKGVEAYIFQLSRVPNMSVYVKELFVTDESIVLDSLTPGVSYYWRVRPIGAFDYCGNYSKVTKFVTSKRTTAIDEADNIDVKHYVESNNIIHIHNIHKADYKVNISNIHGQSIPIQSMDSFDGYCRIQTAHMQTGNYILSLRSAKKQQFIKFTVL